MKKTRWMNLLLALSLALAGCGLDGGSGAEVAAGGTEEVQSEIDLAMDAFWESWDAAEDAEAKVALAREFLEAHPGSEHTSNVMEAVIGPLVEELGREQEAYAIFEEALAGVSDREERFDARKTLAILHTKTGRLDELRALTSALEEEYEFQFTDYLDFMETAVEAQAWELAIQQADASLALATPEAFREQWPDIAEEDAEAWGRRREAFAAAHKGWALQNLGRHAEALGTFAGNAEKTTYSFLGVDDTPLHLRWGMSLTEQDWPEEAMAVLEAEALFGPEEARAAYAEAWAASRGSSEGLEEHLWDLRVERGKPLPGFALANYEGETIDSADFEGDVLLVAAWFPT